MFILRVQHKEGMMTTARKFANDIKNKKSIKALMRTAAVGGLGLALTGCASTLSNNVCSTGFNALVIGVQTVDRDCMTRQARADLARLSPDAVVRAAAATAVASEDPALTAGLRRAADGSVVAPPVSNTWVTRRTADGQIIVVPPTPPRANNP